MKVQNWLITALFLVVSFSVEANGGEWNGTGTIKTMFIYPTSAIIVQGNSWAGTAGCSDNDGWSFNWSEFDQPTQARIQSMLLSAYVSQTPIQVAIHTSGCGPEGRKHFNGQIMFP